jgi:hypothetical protein
MSFIGTLFGSGRTNDQKQANNLLNYNAQTASRNSGTALNTGLNYLNQFSNNLQGPTNYFQSLLSGNQAQSTAALAPNINQIQGQQNQALQSASNLSPRGGGRSSTLFNLPFQAASQISGLYNSLRPQAAQGLESIAGMEGNMGSNLVDIANRFLQSGTQASGLYGSQAGQQSLQQQQNAQRIMNLLTTAMSKIKLPGFGGGGGLGDLDNTVATE